jgi:hypothetical protein
LLPLIRVCADDWPERDRLTMFRDNLAGSGPAPSSSPTALSLGCSKTAGCAGSKPARVGAPAAAPLAERCGDLLWSSGLQQLAIAHVQDLAALVVGASRQAAAVPINANLM